jgi:hypothetical protein
VVVPPIVTKIIIIAIRLVIIIKVYDLSKDITIAFFLQ